MKDLGKSSFALGIETHHDRNHSMLDLSQESYIDCVLKRFNMPNSLPGQVPLEKRNKLN